MTDYALLANAEQQIRDTMDRVYHADSRDVSYLPLEFVHLAESILDALAAIQRSDDRVQGELRKQFEIEHRRHEKAADALLWLDGHMPAFPADSLEAVFFNKNIRPLMDQLIEDRER